MRGFSIRIFVPDGVAEGLRVIEKSNWTGRGLVCPRSRFAEARTRDDFSRTGVYVLTGPSEEGSLPRIYVGEGDPIRPRLEQHATKKDFWTSVVFFVSKDDNLNKAHVQYLESRLVRLAREAKRCVLDNANEPTLPSLSEADVADVEGFLDEMLLCLPIVGINAFDKPGAEPPRTSELRLVSKETEARGYESENGFVVRQGSKGRIDEVPSIHAYMSDLRRQLLQQGVFVSDGNHLLVTQDYEFNSPSTAAGVLLGRTANGRVEWRDASGRTLKEIQEAKVGGSSST